MTQQPSIGRIVHVVPVPEWRSLEPCVAAIITSVPASDTGMLPVKVTVFQPEALPGYVRSPLPYDEGHTPGTWHWPERTDFPLPTEYSTEGLNPPPTLIPRPDREPGPDVP